MISRLYFIFLLLICSANFKSCSWSYGTDQAGINDDAAIVHFDLQAIQQRGKLIAITGYNPLSYFLYKGRPMGYDYELLKMFADEIGVELEMLVAHDLDSVYHFLNSGKGDIIAFGQTLTRSGKDKVEFTEPYMEVRQVLVQRKPEHWLAMNSGQLSKQLIKDTFELAGMQVHVKAGTAHFERILDLAESIKYEIDVVPVNGDVTVDDLIEMVVEKEINYTIADENVALLAATYYQNLDVQTTVSGNQGLAWAVRKNSTELQNALNEWIGASKGSHDYNLIYKKYFKSQRQITNWAQSDLFSQTSGKISVYDEIIRKYASRIGLDWRLIAAIIYKESQFDPYACSWAGAEGLMQLMPATGLRFGVYDLEDPEQNIRAGVSYIHWLLHFWSDIPDENERLKFVIASYNVGEGHVRDAVRLAEKNCARTDIWDENVEMYLLKKSKPLYYNDEVVSNGYCRGEVTVNYVKEVLYQYRHYAQIINS